MGTAWGRAGYRGEDSRGRKGGFVSLLSWNETLVRRRESARRVQPGRLRPGLEEDARVPRHKTTIIVGSAQSQAPTYYTQCTIRPGQMSPDYRVIIGASEPKIQIPESSIHLPMTSTPYSKA